MIRAVLWDLGGVLSHFRPECRVAAIARRCGAPENIVRAVLNSDLLGSLDVGEMSLDELLNELRDRLNWRWDADELGRAWAEAFEPNVAVLDLVRRTQARAAVITNNGPPISDHYAQLLPSVAAVVPSAFFSAETRCVKPDPEAFLGACAALEVEPAQVLLIDDSPKNIRAAAACGLRTRHFHSPGRLEEALQSEGLLGGG